MTSNTANKRIYLGLFKAILLQISLLLPILFVLMPIAISSKVQAGDNIWTPVGLHGAKILDIAIVPNNDQEIYAITASQSFIYKSTDGGDTWLSILGNTSFDWGSRILFDPNTTDTIYVVGGENTLYISQDAGTTWVSKPITITVGAGHFETIHASTVNYIAA